jgi:serine/threonine-protein kinase
MQNNHLLNNRYQLISKIGSGGMAVVFKARDLMLERDVAIKVLRKDYSENPSFRQRFRHEAKAAANLSHSNIVTIHDFGFDQAVLFIVMEFIPGITLKKYIGQQGRLTTKEAVPLMVQACEGIGYAHRAGILHCDIKPQNILITHDRRAKVTDFGIARALSSIRSDEQSSIVWGSPQYFSPEQAAGKAPSPASDVYSLGVIFFEMLTGQLPFSANSSQELAQLHKKSLPPEPKKLNPAITDDLNRIILKILSKEATARYRTADQLKQVLVTYSEKNESIPISKNIIKAGFKGNQQRLEVTDGTRIGDEDVKKKLPEVILKEGELDWITISLGLVALLFVGGLIPFWLWVYFTLQSQ